MMRVKSYSKILNYMYLVNSVLCHFPFLKELKYMHNFKQLYWIDSTDIGREGKWVTLSTGKSGYTNWHSRPDNAGGNQHCAFNNFGRHLGRWDDVGCKYPLQVICEASGILFSISCQNCFIHVLKLLLLR